MEIDGTVASLELTKNGDSFLSFPLLELGFFGSSWGLYHPVQKVSWHRAFECILLNK